MKNIIFTLVFLLIIPNSTFPQVSQQWVSLYGGPSGREDGTYSLVIDKSGNTYVTGWIRNSTTIESEDYATVKYNSSGDTVWVRIYNGPANNRDAAISIAIDPNGNIYVTGMSTGAGTGTDIVTIKYTSSGVQKWLARYNGPANSSDYPFDISADAGGNVYVTGYSRSGSAFGTEDYITIKYDSLGVQKWAERYNGPGNAGDQGQALAVDLYGNVFVTGYSYHSSTGATIDYATIKYNQAGAQQWLQRYNGPSDSNDFGYAIAVDNSGNAYVTGASYGLGTNSDYTTIKYSASGSQEWVTRYNGPGNSSDNAVSIVVSNTGIIYITGYSVANETGLDYATVKYNSAGIEQWVQRYNGYGTNFDYAKCVVLDKYENIYITGWSPGENTSDDYATIKYSPSGERQWVMRYNGPASLSDFGYCLAVDTLMNVYVTGRINKGNYDYDFATIKYSQVTGIRKLSNSAPPKFLLYQNYPNPFNSSTNIRFEIPDSKSENENFALKIYDYLGREVSSLVSELLSPGVYEIQFNADNLPTGIYFYRLHTHNLSQTKPMLLLK